MFKLILNFILNFTLVKSVRTENNKVTFKVDKNIKKSYSSYISKVLILNIFNKQTANKTWRNYTFLNENIKRYF